MRPKKRTSMNTGTVQFVKPKNLPTDFNEKKNVRSMADLQLLKTKFYSVEAIRQQDQTFAEQMGRSLTLKIKTVLDSELTPLIKAVIRNTLYDVISVDHDLVNRETYIYLEEVREIEK